MKLTAKMKKEYLAHKGVRCRCPYCKSRNLDCPDGFFMTDGLNVVAIIQCNDCTQEWKDFYTLTDVQNT